MAVMAWSEVRQHVGDIDTLIKGAAAGALFVFDASDDRLAGRDTYGVPPIHHCRLLVQLASLLRELR